MAKKVNTAGGYEFSARQLTALELMVSGETQASVARTLGADPSVVNRWAKNPLFRSELARRRAEVLESIRAGLSQTVETALAAVRAGLADDEVSGTVKLQVAASFLAKLVPGILRLETEAPDVDEALKTEAERRRDRFLSATLDGVDDIRDEAARELERDC